MKSIEEVTVIIRSGDHGRALEALAELIARPSTRCEALGHRAWLFRSQGKYEAALTDYESLAAENASHGEARARLAETLLLMGRGEEAAKAALEALRLDPANTVAIGVLAAGARSIGRESEIAPPGGTSAAGSVIELLESCTKAFPTSVMPEIGRLLHAWVRCIRPRIIIETGSYIGYSALWIARGLEENGAGHLHSFDLFESRGEYISPVIGAAADSLEIARAHLERAELGHRVTFHKGDSSTNIAREFAVKNLKADMAFIDGDHTVQGCARDWAAIDPLLSDGATVFVHDTIAGDANHWAGPQALLERIAGRVKTEYQWVNLPTADRLGMAIIQKQGANLFAWNPSLAELARQWFFHRLIKK